jgi:Ca2+-binding RTX toxin-like protein
MPITRVSTNDTGGGHRIRMDAGSDGSLAVISNEGNTFLSRIDEGGTESLLAATADWGLFPSGFVETLSDGRYAIYSTYHSGLGQGARAQILNADGSDATAVINPMFEDGVDRSGAGYALAATQSGGFAFVWNDTSRTADSMLLTYPEFNGSSQTNVGAGHDVRIRYFNGSAVGTNASVVADDDVETISGATVSRRAGDQFVNDAETLAGGQTAFAFIDRRYVGKPGGGYQEELQLSLQISTPGNVGEPIKVDLGPFGEQFGEYPQTLEANAAVNVVPLPDGTLAVIWTEKTYVAAPVFGGWAASGTQSLIRYFDAAGTALTGAIPIVTRGTSHGNHSLYVWGEALPDGRIAIAYNIGVDGGGGNNGTLDAFIGIVGALGSGLEVAQINPTASNTQFYTIEDFAVRSDGTLELAYHDESGAGSNTLIERFVLTGATGSGQVGTAAGETLSGGSGGEVMFGQAGNDTLLGNGGIDALHGGEGDDILSGGTGADRMFGDAGNDTFTVDSSLDKVFETSGADTDTVRSSASFTLGSNVENLVLTGGGNVNGTGNALVNALTGNNGNNRLDGGAAADTMAGGLGHDVYVVNHVGDTVFENGSAGTDSVESSVTYTLPIHFEKLILTGTLGNIGRGNGGANTITGNSGGNFLSGGSGNDIMNGAGGNDRLIGGPGNDNLTGGTGNDRFEFTAALGAANVDRILDFSVPNDTIQLLRSVFTKAGANGTLSAAAFHVGPTAGDAGDRIVFDTSTQRIYYDPDGTGPAAQILFATVPVGTALTNADFVIYG